MEKQGDTVRIWADGGLDEVRRSDYVELLISEIKKRQLKNEVDYPGVP